MGLERFLELLDVTVEVLADRGCIVAGQFEDLLGELLLERILVGVYVCQSVYLVRLLWFYS